MALWIPPEGSFVFLDTNIIVEARNKFSFSRLCQEYLDTFVKNRINIVIPQIVRAELLRNTKNINEFKSTEGFLDNFLQVPVTKEIIDLAIRYNALYHWRASTKQYSVTALNDLIIGASAAQHKKTTGRKTYIFSFDSGYCDPYFQLTAKSTEKNGKVSKIFYLYRPNIYNAERDWNRSLSNLVSK